MRKIKKINGYLVVKFNAREIREWEGTALGEYGVIDAELYTGYLGIDRGAMEYDGVETLEEAVELARGLESEEDIIDEPPKDNFRHQPDGVPTTGLFTLGMKLLEDCPENDCIIYRNIFKTCLELDEQIDRVTGRAREVLNSELRREVYKLWEMFLENYAVGEYRKARKRKPEERSAPPATPCKEEVHPYE